MVSEDRKTEAPKGLLAMFGGGGKTAAQLPSTTAATKSFSFSTNVKSTPIDQKESSAGGGAWRTAGQRRSGRSLALKARMPGKTVSITASKGAANGMDSDDDITMGGMGKKKNKKRFSPYGRNRPKKAASVMQTAPEQRVDILIQGFAPGTENGLIPYLQMKSKKQWNPVDARVEPGQMLLTVSDPAIAGTITRLDGYIFGSEQLSIRLFSETSATNDMMADEPKKVTTIDTLRAFLRSRWNSDMKYLNLDDMASDPILKKGGIRPPGASGATEVVGPAMMKLAGEMFEEVTTISFARNRLRNVQPISVMTQYLPNLQNVSFQDNLIGKYEGIDALSGTGKLKHLREFVLLGNPLRESEIKQRGNDRAYIRNMVKRFPTMVLLDGVPAALTEEERQSVQKSGKVLPLDTKSNFFDNEASQSTGWDFLNRYFQAFDSNRGPLAALYDANAMFSVSTRLKLRKDNKIRRREKKKMMEDEGEKVTWTTMDRNLAKSSSKTPGKHLICGPEAIGDALVRLPATIHDLKTTKDFVMDAYQLPLGLCVHLHGEFKEDENSGPLSFDRTFILRPAIPGSRAMAEGWPYMILSDMLCVRDYVGNQGFQPNQQATTSIFAAYPSLPQPPVGQ
ncbi:uncharacterized protein BYT42DRAFT_175572 [Radiomyces spectabilis]|uniref:uncharacterized protein n=1 Tax=Radiomyces spectabilis TaxID=64574 RepID=UPI0022202FC0|nr:uncharacterized protein BYT42DRAFT_175572 [Radiomyces spectabilis]KAI8390949.1 hypothetical protein BYT42DRAFT_175572 [Radiomyces spectabilis]